MKYFLYILFIVQFVSNAQASVTTNAESLELLAKQAIEFAIDNINLPDSTKIVYSISQNPADFLLEKELLANSKFQFFSHVSNNDSNLHKLSVITKDFYIEFNELFNDNLERIAKLDFLAMMEYPNGHKILLSDTSLVGNSIINIDLAERLNSTAPRFAKAQLPNKKRSIYEKLVQPAIVITATVLTVVLFFSVRSK